MIFGYYVPHVDKNGYYFIEVYLLNYERKLGEFRRQKIATNMYEKAERDLGRKLVRGDF